MSTVARFADAVWSNVLVKEFVLLLVSALAVVLVAQLVILQGILEDDPSLAEFRTWFHSSLFVLWITAAKQAVAWAIARLGGNAL